MLLLCSNHKQINIYTCTTNQCYANEEAGCWPLLWLLFSFISSYWWPASIQTHGLGLSPNHQICLESFLRPVTSECSLWARNVPSGF